MPFSAESNPAPDRQGSSAPSPRRIPLFVKILLTLFVCAIIPIYYRDYGPANFLYICDTALVLTTLGVWLESALLISMQAVGILLPQTIWLLDFLLRLCGLHTLGISDYMFNPGLPALARGLSLFHGWLPILLVWLLIRLGYDRRAFLAQTLFGVTLMLVCYFVSPIPPATGDNLNAAVNINYVFGPDPHSIQAWVDGRLWLLIMCAAIVFVAYLPTHSILCRIFEYRRAPGELPESSSSMLGNRAANRTEIGR